MLGLGGSESIVMWLIEALKKDFYVTVITTGGWDLDTLNDFYGTQVKSEEVNVRIAPVPALVSKFSAAAVRGACYQRFAREIAPEYDIRISAYNPTDWGLPAIHFIADFSWDQATRELLHPRSPGLIYRSSPLRWTYLRIAAAYGRPSGRNFFQEDQFVANSSWSAGIMEKRFGVQCRAVVYPPIWAKFPEVCWEEKEEAFVIIGRIAPEKRIEEAIAILESVRKRGHQVRLHLCGQIEDTTYGRQIARLCRERAAWIITEGRVTGDRKAQILASCRFGIQMCAAEAFGISVAEMAKAGAIVFAPDSGGQAEIVQLPDLLFADSNDAVEKILAVLTNLALRSKLRAFLKQRADHFSTQTFMDDVQEVIRIPQISERASAPMGQSQVL